MERPEKLLKFSFKKKIPVILQSESSECGLACLTMIAGYFGYETDLVTMRRKYSVSAKGLTLSQLMDVAETIHLSARPLSLELHEISELTLPCIIHWDFKHFVILKKVSSRKIELVDPEVGERKISLDEFAKYFTGIALELMPTSEFKPREEKKELGLSSFWKKIIGLKRSIINILLLTFLLQIFGLLGPYYMQTVIDSVIVRSDTDLLTVLALGFGLLLVIETTVTYIRRNSILLLSTNLAMQMSSNVFNHLIKLSLDYFEKRHVGDIISKFGSLKSIRGFITTGVISVVIDGTMSLITLAVMIAYSPLLTIIVIAALTIHTAVKFITYYPIKALNKEKLIVSAKESSHFIETLRAMQTIKLFEKENARRAIWQNKLADTMNKGIKLSKWSMNIDAFNQILFGIENILIVYIAAQMVILSDLSLGMLFAFVSYKTRFVGATNGTARSRTLFNQLN